MNVVMDMSRNADSALGAGAAMAFVLPLVFSVLGLAFYVFSSLQVQNMLKFFGSERPWFAWLPYAKQYAMAELCIEYDGKVTVCNKKVSGGAFKFWMLIATGVQILPFIGQIASIVLMLICYIKCYSCIFGKLDGVAESDVKGKAVVCTLFGVVVPFMLMRYDFSTPQE